MGKRALTPEQVYHYKQAWGEKRMTTAQIALEAGVGLSTVERVLRGLTYRDIPKPEELARSKEVRELLEKELAADAVESQRKFAKMNPEFARLLKETQQIPPSPLDE